MITLKQLIDNYYSVFRIKKLPRTHHSSARHNGDYVLLRGTAMGTQGMYTMEVELQKDEAGKVNYLSPVSYIHCSCPAFQYFVQDPLAKAGSTHPGTGHVNKRINNPKQVPAPCKHLYAYLQNIMNRGVLNRVNMTAPVQRVKK